MSGGENPRDGEFEQASSRLNQGLKSCRSVVNNYRAILTGDHCHGDNDDRIGWEISGYVSTTGTVSESDDIGWDDPRG
jgi:hypothetical protein